MNIVFELQALLASKAPLFIWILILLLGNPDSKEFGNVKSSVLVSGYLNSKLT